MRRDYAKYRAKRSPTPKWSWHVAVVLVVAVIIGGGCLFYKHNGVATVKTLFTHKKQSQATPANLTQPEEPHFDFYTELPNMQVTVSNQPKAAENSPKVAEPKSKPANISTPQYIVDLGVFSDANSASQLRVSLLLGGFESEIVKLKATGRIRVQQGPFTTQSQAIAAQKKLLRGGIEGEVKQIDLEND